MSIADLNFVNKSLSASPVDVVFFDPFYFYDLQTIRLPWLLIKKCSYDFSHPFQYEFSLDMQLRDDWGNCSLPVYAQPGTRYVITNTGGHYQLLADGTCNSNEVEIFNALLEGAPTIVLSRGGKPTALRSSLVPGEYFSFRIPDTLLGRKVSGVVQALRLKQLESDGYCSSIALAGVQNADLVLTGGGAGALAKKYSITLQKSSSASI